MRLFAIFLTAAAVSVLAPPAATAQQTTTVQPPRAVAPQVVWTPTYYYDATGALWLVYVPSAPAAPAQTPSAPAPVQSFAPVQPKAGPGSQASPSLVNPRNREQGTGRNVQMHKPWMKGRR